MGSVAWLSGAEFAFFSACGTAGRTADSEYLFRGQLGHKRTDDDPKQREKMVNFEQ